MHGVRITPALLRKERDSPPVDVRYRAAKSHRGKPRGQCADHVRVGVERQMTDLCRTTVHFDEVRPARCGLEHEVEADEARKSQVPNHARRRVAHFRRVNHANDGRGTGGIHCLQCLDAEAREHFAAMAHNRPVGWPANDIFLQGDRRTLAIKAIKIGKIKLLERHLHCRARPG